MNEILFCYSLFLCVVLFPFVKSTQGPITPAKSCRETPICIKGRCSRIKTQIQIQSSTKMSEIFLLLLYGIQETCGRFRRIKRELTFPLSDRPSQMVRLRLWPTVLTTHLLSKNMLYKSFFFIRVEHPL